MTDRRERKNTRAFTDGRMAIDNDMGFQLDTVAELHIRTDHAKRADLHISAESRA